jgi:hypothetical protein
MPISDALTVVMEHSEVEKLLSRIKMEAYKKSVAGFAQDVIDWLV